jgi:hypothetical protein
MARKKKYTGCVCECSDPLVAGSQKPPKLGKAGAKKGLEGEHCVVNRKGKPVRCFKKRATAEKVARGFGSGFRVRSKGGRSKS